MSEIRPVNPWSVVTDMMNIARSRAGVRSIDGRQLDGMHDAARRFLAALDIPEATDAGEDS